MEHSAGIGNWGYCGQSCPPLDFELRKIVSVTGAKQTTASSTTTVKTTTTIEGVLIILHFQEKVVKN